MSVGQIDEGAEILLEDTPDASTMRGFSEKIQADYLQNLKLPGLDTTVADSEAFTKEVMARVAGKMGKRNTVADVNQWAGLNYSELSSELGVDFTDMVINAQAQGVLDSASSVYGQSLTLGSVTENALADGNLSIPEATQIGASAMSTASSVMGAVGASVALGAACGMFAVIAVGVSFLSASGERYNAMRRAKLAQAATQIDLEAQVFNEALAAFEEEYNAEYQRYWDSKDTAVAFIANAWTGYQGEMGYDFDLRYFPGSPTPIRGGLMFDDKRTSTFYLSKVPTCENPVGCLYFPIRGDSKSNRYVVHPDIDQSSPQASRISMAPYFAPPIDAGFLSGYEYYFKALRAFDAHVPNKFDSAGNPIGFWVPPSHPMRKRQEIRRYAQIAAHWYCRVTSRTGSSIAPDCRCPDEGFTSFLPEPPGCPVRDSSNPAVGQLKKAQAYEKTSIMRPYVEEYLERKREIFDRAAGSVPVYKVRVQSDLIQTANAVSGELAAIRRLGELKSEFGVNDLRSLSNTQKLSTKVLGELGPLLKKEGERRSNIVNNLMLGAGGAAVAFGAYKKFRR